jgi:YD repeat-containing protein
MEGESNGRGRARRAIGRATSRKLSRWLLVGALLLAAGALTLGVSSLSAQTSCAAHGRVRPNQPSPPLPQCDLNDVARAARRHRTAPPSKLASATARAARTASQMRFHGLAKAAAIHLDQSDFAARLQADNPAANVERAGKVQRYIGDYKAVVRTAKQREKIFTSSVPLRTGGRGSHASPVDLALRSGGNGYSPVNALLSMHASRQLAGGVSLSDGLSIAPIAGNVTATPAPGDQNVYYANAGPDEDFSINATVRGAEISTLLRSRLSPQHISYRLTLPSGAKLVQHANELQIVRQGRPLAAIPPASAVDAQGRLVPVTTRLAGDVLTLTVPHDSMEVAYPVLVDPRIIVTPRTPEWHLRRGGHLGGAIEAPGPGALRAPAGVQYSPGEITEFTPAQQDFEEKIQKCPECGIVEYEYVYGEPMYGASAEWEWEWPGGRRFRENHLTEVNYYGVNVTPTVYPTSEPNGSGYEGGTGTWSYTVGCFWNEYASEAPPPTVKCLGGPNHATQSPPFINLSLNRAPTEGVWWGACCGSRETNGGKGFSIRVAPTSDPFAVSVEAVLVAEEGRARRRHGRHKREMLGLRNPAIPNWHDPCEEDPVDCTTGNFTEAQTDFAVPTRGIPLNLERTYNAQAAVEGEPGLFGYGWSWSFGAALVATSGEEGERKIVEQSNGSTVVFEGSEGALRPSEPGVEASLRFDPTKGQTIFTLPTQEVMTFDGSGGSGHLISETDRNGNVTTVAEPCDGQGCRIEVTDPVGRKMTLYKNSEGLVERATDPMGHTVTYTYENGDLASVTLPGESSPRWRFRYDSRHRMIEMVDGRGAKVTNEYDEQDRVVEQTDARGDTRHYHYEELGGEELQGALSVSSETQEEEYSLSEMTPEEEEIMAEGYEVIEEHPYTPPEYVTRITDSGSGATTYEHFNSEDELDSITDGYGTPLATTRTFTYDGAGAMESETDGNRHRTSYGYDSEGNKTSETNALDETTKWEYDSAHDVIGETTPRGEKTTIHRDSAGNAREISRPAPGGETQTFKYEYNAFGELTGVTNPLGHTWKYEYDGDGDRTAEIAPEGEKRTFAYNRDSQQVATTSPRGNAPGAEPGRYTTITERDQQGRVVRVIEPLE